MKKLKKIFAAAHQNADKRIFTRETDIFYIIYTSGTTGKPKGVQISHDNLLDFVRWMNSSFDLKPNECCLLQPPFSFDLSVMALYPSLVAGRKMVVLPQTVTDDFKKLFRILPRLTLNEWISTPSFMQLCLLDKNFSQELIPELQQVIFCGEELNAVLVKQVQARFPNAHIFNTYGPTETTVAKTSIEITPAVIQDYPRLPIGKAATNTKILALDQGSRTPVVGKKGEIVIVGPGVSVGYLNDPAKTKTSFLKIDGKLAYQTGDLGQVDEQGIVTYYGRLDFQIKLHGYRIELEDVDQHLCSLQEVKQAVAVPKYSPSGQVTQIVAYVVLKNGLPEDEFKNQKKYCFKTFFNTNDYEIYDSWAFCLLYFFTIVLQW